MKNRMLQGFLIIGFMALVQNSFAEKKAGESCESHSDCETRSCRDHKCEVCPDADHCPTPGVCSESQHSSLKEEVQKWCKTESVTCQNLADYNGNEVEAAALKSRLEYAEKCVDARWAMMHTCYKDGDSTHRDKRNEYIGVKNQCVSLLEYKRGLSLLYTCSESDYKSYLNKVATACEKEWKTDVIKDSSRKVDCRKLDQLRQNNQECLDARQEIVNRCFDGKESSIRQTRKEERQAAIARIADVLDYQKSNSACE